MDSKLQVQDFADLFEAEGTVERAEGEKKYLKSPLIFHGVTVPFIRKTAKAFRRAHPELSHAEVLQLVDRLWTGRFHNLRSLGTAIAELYVDRLEPDDLAAVEAQLRRSSSWDHVDWLSTGVVAPLVEAHSELGATLDRWARDESFWIRRASMLVLLPALRRGDGDFERFERYAEPLLEEKEFFIRKAIGWVLREVSKKRPELTIAFLERHLPRLAGLTFREASRRLPEAEQLRLRTAFHDRS